MPRIILLLLFSISAGVLSAQKMPVIDALKKGWVKVTIKGKGGHVGDVIEMIVSNISGKDLDLVLEAGHRLDSKDSTVQDVLVNREEKFVLGSGKTKTVAVSGMCCQARKHSPAKESIFLVGQKADRPAGENGEVHR